VFRHNAGADLLVLVLRWTGFRGSDAESLVFREVNFMTKEIDKITGNGKESCLAHV
jgi:hypothetical protein